MQHQSYSPYAFSPNADAYGPDFSYRSPSTNEYHEPTPSIEMQVEARPAETYVNPFAEANGFAAPPVSPEYFASHTPVASPLEYSRPFNPRGVSVVDEQETSIMSTSGLSSFAQGSDKYESNYSRALSSNRVASTSYNSPFSRLQSGGQSISPSFGPPPSTTPSFPAASYSAYNPYAHRPTGPPTAPSHRLPTLPSHVQTFTPSAFSHNPSDPFDYRALGFSAPPPQPLAPSSFKNIYSSSGFDLTRLLARVVERENPVIELGAIDASCSFVVVDARKADQPIVYASETFSKLTGYSNEEIVGRNCRFLQAPGGHVVEQGAKRLYTDGNAVHHLRQHLVRGEEAQVSLINYTKEGRPFINLTTVIPITLSRDSQVIEYFVGFQVDLVDQPQAIREKTPTSYVVDYTRSVLTAYRVPSVASTVDLENAHAMARQVAGGPSSATLLQEVKEEPRESSPDLIELVAHNSHGLNGLSDDGVRKQFNRLLVDSCPDIILVVSLKGTLLYVSAASERILGYSDLTGKTLASFCHPSDIVTVQRELKEAGALAANGVNIVFRMRTTSGYVFVEASGRLHVDPGKGRKCVILTMRPHEVCSMSWRDLEANGGLSSSPVDEFFAKLCVDAIFLQATKAAEQVLSVKNVDSSIVGMSIGDLSPPGTDDAQRATDALLQASRGNVTSVQHKLRGGDGRYIDVVTRFYPRGDQDSAPSKLTAVGGKALSVIAQVSLLSSEPAKQQQRAKLASSLASSSAAGTAGSSSSRRSDVGSYATAATSLARSSFSHYQPSPHLSGGSTIGAPVMSAALPGASSSSGNFSFSVSAPSTFKNLATPSHAVSDNIFEELEGTRGTSWQFELHQMRLTNKKLREERDALEAIRKRKTSAANAPPAPVMKKSAASQRACANCGRTTSSEWRSGPTGSKTLCNACGLRWSKSKSQAAAAEKKRKAEAAQVAAALAAASPPPPAHNFASPSGGSSSEETGFRRDSGTGSGNGSGGDSTDPTTASPAMSPYQQSPFCAGPNEYFGNGSGKNGVGGAAAVGGSGGMYPHPPAYSYAQRPHLPHQPSSLYPYSPNAG